jgi:hypothetical protein
VCLFLIGVASGAYGLFQWLTALGASGADAIGFAGNFEKYIDPRTTCSTAGIPRLALQDPNQILQPSTDDYVLWGHGGTGRALNHNT